MKKDGISDSRIKKICKLVISAAAGVIAGCVLINSTPVQASVLPLSSYEQALEKTGGVSKIREKNNDKKDTFAYSKKQEEQVYWDDHYTEEDLRYMAAIIFCEANDMGHDAMLAVANVIINRANDKGEWGHVNTVKDVIFDRKWAVQFSPTAGSNPKIYSALDVYDNLQDYVGNWKYDAFLNCIEAAKAAFSGEKAIPDSFMYFNGHIEASKAKCKSSGKKFKVIDKHIYY